MNPTAAYVIYEILIIIITAFIKQFITVVDYKTATHSYDSMVNIHRRSLV